MKEPSEKDFLALTGKRAALWTELRTWLSGHYPHSPELSVGKKAHDWTIRYRRSGRTLVTLMPEPGGFCVLVVLGKDEVVAAKRLELNAGIRGALDTAKQFHDGRWLWIRPRTMGDLDSIRRLLAVKRPPSP
ncbi:MAG: DUF3788 domain-containing protein [Candidatus Edwardsbacteria bacterium]|jgi:hypothetical protein|nr:DUF3788 domain-containing protein [Candidatus Edwardsbacteria bacterium]